ncbi:hypothetical protein [Zhihengliuella sp.]|uniref:hypothetical protein n=1 Tax=Zhihengliuella sp. TaxID=1954483 RepID=UPI00281259BC|nr:hypothetical protein [Zhihengliuella sp.]
MNADQLVDDVLTAHERVAEAEQEVRDRVALRAAAVKAAIDGGAGATNLARALGVSRARIYDMAKQG